MWCRQKDLAEIELTLVYFDILSTRETLISERFTCDALQAHFEHHCARFLQWSRMQAAHRKRRDEFLAGLEFPYRHCAAVNGSWPRQFIRALPRGARY